MNWTPEEYDRHIRKARSVAKPATGKGKSRSNAVKTIVDGITFLSKREAARWVELTLWQKSGGIRNLRRQPRYALCPLIIDLADCRDVNAGIVSIRRLPVAHYVGDFEYEECDHANGHSGWKLVVEDCKGFKTQMYLIKKRWFEAQYQIQIRET